MLRRIVQRARRRFPVHKPVAEGHEPNDALYDSPHAGAISLSLSEDTNHEKDSGSASLRKTSVSPQDDIHALRIAIRNHVQTVANEERDSTRAFARLQELYKLFQVANDTSSDGIHSSSHQNGTDGDRSVNQSAMQSMAMRDLDKLSHELPEGFSSDTFVALGDALYAEMQESGHSLPISRTSFEKVGDSMHPHAAVSA